MNVDAVYTDIAEDLIAAINEEHRFDFWLSFRLVDRSKEAATAVTSDQVLTDVLNDLVLKNLDRAKELRSRKLGSQCYLFPQELPKIAAALKPLCDRAFPMLNTLLSLDREILFAPCDYIRSAGRLYYEEAPGITFTRYMNDMERHRKNKSVIYEREVPRIAEVHALNRAANIMPREFHRGFDGKLEPGQTVEDRKRAERRAMWRKAFGDMTMADLLAEAGMA